MNFHELFGLSLVSCLNSLNNSKIVPNYSHNYNIKFIKKYSMKPNFSLRLYVNPADKRKCLTIITTKMQLIEGIIIIQLNRDTHQGVPIINLEISILMVCLIQNIEDVLKNIKK